MWYGASISDIERNYGCVTEYNRCMEERAEYEAEKEAEARDRYQKNKYRMENAGIALVASSDLCSGCPHYEDIGMTWSEDDFMHGICKNMKCDKCQHHERIAVGKLEGRFTFDDYSYYKPGRRCLEVYDPKNKVWFQAGFFKTKEDAEDFLTRLYGANDLQGAAAWLSTGY